LINRTTQDDTHTHTHTHTHIYITKYSSSFYNFPLTGNLPESDTRIKVNGI